MARIEIEIFYPFAPELVWDALTNPEALGEWLMENNFQPRVGHKFQFRGKPQKGWDGIVDCEVLEIDRPKCLSYSWAGGKKHETVVTWTLSADADGTRLKLAHTGFKGMGGFILSKLILGPGWKKMLRKYVPVLLDHMKKRGTDLDGLKLKNSCH